MILTKAITINGITKSLKEWAKESGISYDTLYGRLKKGVPEDSLLLSTKERNRTILGSENGVKTKSITINGVTKSLQMWADESGIPYDTLYGRLMKEIPEELILLSTIERNKRLSTESKKEKTIKNIHVPSKTNPQVTIGGITRTLKEWSILSGIDYNVLRQRHNYGFKPEQLLLDVGIRRGNPDIKTITIKGVSKTINEWAKEANLSVSILNNRLANKWDEKDLLKPKGYTRNGNQSKMINVNGKEKTIAQLSDETGISKKTLQMRVRKGWKEKDLLSPVQIKFRRKTSSK